MPSMLNDMFIFKVQMQNERKDDELRAVMESREEALREVEKLVHHTENMERNSRHKVCNC